MPLPTTPQALQGSLEKIKRVLDRFDAFLGVVELFELAELALNGLQARRQCRSTPKIQAQKVPSQPPSKS